MLEPAAETELMREFASRDPPAAHALYERYASRVYGLGVVMLGDHAAAEDLVQDTFVKLWRAASRFDGSRGRLDTYVLMVARSLAIDGLRRRVVESRSLERTGASTEADQGPGPDEIAATGDLVARARGAMVQLSDEQRAALELAYFGGRTMAEVAEIEGIPLGTAKTRIRAALLRLRDVMARERESET
jgi:RNA polymerase sigma-70 factor (ECF subfamily)